MLLLNLLIETLSHHLGFLEMLKSCVGKIKYLTGFVVLGSPQNDFRPIIFGRPCLNTLNATIDCHKQTVSVRFGDGSHEFNFSKFNRQPHKKELPSKDKIIGLASIAVPPTNPLEQLLDHENDMFMNERNELDEIFLFLVPHKMTFVPLSLVELS